MTSKLNATQTSILNAVKAGKLISISNRNDVANRQVHHATAKVLVAAGLVTIDSARCLVLVAGKDKKAADPVKTRKTRTRKAKLTTTATTDPLPTNGPGKVCQACGEHLAADEVGCGCCGHKRPMGWRKAA